MRAFKRIITNTTVDVKTTELFYNKNGANISTKGDDIYIDCQPVGNDGQLLVNESVSGSSMTSGTNTNIDMEKIEPFLYLIGGLFLAVGISYGVNYLFTKFKKDK